MIEIQGYCIMLSTFEFNLMTVGNSEMSWLIYSG